VPRFCLFEEPRLADDEAAGGSWPFLFLRTLGLPFSRLLVSSPFSGAGVVLRGNEVLAESVELAVSADTSWLRAYILTSLSSWGLLLIQ